MGIDVTGEAMQVHHVRHATIIAIGELGLTRQSDVSHFMERVGDIVTASSDPLIVLDCQRVAALGSILLGELISLNKTLEADGRQLRLAGLNDEAMRVIQITGLENLLKTFPDIRSAVFAKSKRRWWWPFG